MKKMMYKTRAGNKKNANWICRLYLDSTINNASGTKQALKKKAAITKPRPSVEQERGPKGPDKNWSGQNSLFRPDRSGQLIWQRQPRCGRFRRQPVQQTFCGTCTAGHRSWQHLQMRLWDTWRRPRDRHPWQLQ